MLMILCIKKEKSTERILLFKTVGSFVLSEKGMDCLIILLAQKINVKVVIVGG